MTAEEQWIEKWKFHLCGLAMFGAWEESNSGPLKRAEHQSRMAPKVEALMRSLFADAVKMHEAAKPPVAKTPIVNGPPLTAAQPKRTT